MLEVVCMWTRACQAGLLGTIHALCVLIGVLSPSRFPGLSQDAVTLRTEAPFHPQVYWCAVAASLMSWQVRHECACTVSECFLRVTRGHCFPHVLPVSSYTDDFTVDP